VLPLHHEAKRGGKTYPNFLASQAN